MEDCDVDSSLESDSDDDMDDIKQQNLRTRIDTLKKEVT